MAFDRLTGFTLFKIPGRGWQLSTRPEGEQGWMVRIIPDSQAEFFLESISKLLITDNLKLVRPAPPSGRLDLRRDRVRL